jgi:hypothetical protein
MNQEQREAWIKSRPRGDWFITVEGIVRKNLWGFNDDLPARGFSVAVYGYYNERYDSIAEIAEANWLEYCRRHGYALRTYPGAFKDELPGAKGVVHNEEGEGRFKLYHDIRGLFQVVMYLDIDSLFVNMEVSIEGRLAESASPPYRRSPRFLWTYDENGPNSSVLIACTDDLTEKHLRFAYERARTENHVRHGKIELGGISDQDAMTDLMNIPPFRDTFGNCRSGPEVGVCYKESEARATDWIVTFSGLSLEQKIERMRSHVNVARLSAIHSPG